MSDALLTEISGKLSKILTALEKGGAPATSKPTTATATAPKADANAVANDTTKSAAEKKAEADKLIAKKKAEKEAAAKAAAAAAAPKAGTKAAGGKHTIEQVREIIRKVAADVDKQSAKDILKYDGGGTERVADLKPEFFDAVYEACEVLLGGEGKSAPAAAEEEDEFA